MHFWFAMTAFSVLSLGIWRVFRYRPQHAGAREGATTVWQLLDQIEAEQYRGRHRLREPVNSPTVHAAEPPRLPPPTEAPAYDAELLRRILRGLEAL